MSEDTTPTYRYGLLQNALDHGELPETFSADQAVAWFEAHHPGQYKPTPIKHLLRDMCVNVHRVGVPESLPRTLYRVGQATYTVYRPEVHGEFNGGRPLIPTDDIEDGDPPAVSDDSVFALEAHLEDFMAANWSKLDFRVPLRPVVDVEGTSGRQFITEVGRIDFLCRDTKTGDLWVLELKRGRSSDRVVGQVLRYMGWVKQHLAADKEVHGLIISHEGDDQLRYALQMVPNVQAWTYQVSFSFNREAVAL